MESKKHCSVYAYLAKDVKGVRSNLLHMSIQQNEAQPAVFHRQETHTG